MGDAIYVDRMTREAECIMHPALSAILSIQPSVLDEIMSNTTMTGRGLIARFLYASPPSRIGSRVFRTQPIPPEITAAYRSLIFRLMALPIAGDAQTVYLSEKAFDLMADYFQEHEKFLVGEGQAISDWASKYIGAVLRIAGLLHCADMEDDKAEVTSSTMSKAIQIGKYFLAHSTYAYSMMGTDLSIQKAKFVLAKLKKEEHIGDQAFRAFSDVPGKVLQENGGDFSDAGTAGGTWIHSSGRTGTPVGGQTSRCRKSSYEPRRMKPGIICIYCISCTELHSGIAPPSPSKNPQIWRWRVRENPVDFPEPWPAGLLTGARKPDTPDLLCG